MRTTGLSSEAAVTGTTGLPAAICCCSCQAVNRLTAVVYALTVPGALRSAVRAVRHDAARSASGGAVRSCSVRAVVTVGLLQLTGGHQRG